ncbi:dipeptidyl aminopeptidase [Cryptococcus deuterogattii 99/473]|uniref:Dipeptidyl aminopeptidase n=1 Tax=Cryptococcus deuterogattii Ram5 TaxID=1296110 RepID=A0A0D0SYZ1_9TREE|nr:dipeptidyl aminopeptidase [Cryptococcus deuterogattii Ram5]KIY55087.1 dipeptidyl aminopeptidase [Cryptococcus deuterogattii 99/473]
MTTDTLLVNASLVLDLEGNQLRWTAWALSADMQYVLFKTDHLKQWRHSSFGNYWIHRRHDSFTFPVVPPTSPPTVAKCTWSPVGHALAFVSKNDVYIVSEHDLSSVSPSSSSTPSHVRVTTDGSHTVFNGVPDWVYEEEVFETDTALWWSPDAKRIAFLRSDESKVHDFKLQYYNPSDDAFKVYQYQTELDMKYPKPGTPNPTVTVHTFSLSSLSTSTGSTERLTWPGEFPLPDRIITEVGWVADDALLVKEIDRAARDGNVVLFQFQYENESGEGKSKTMEGEIGQNVIPVKGSVPGYLDIVPNQGYNHIALFTPLNASKPLWITKGEWEVTEISGVDTEKGLVYFTAATPSIDRHIYSIPLSFSPHDNNEEGGEKGGMTPLTDPTFPGYFQASFSPKAGYYVLGYKGPEVPWQRLIETGPGEDRANVLLEGNAELNKTISEFLKPLVTRTTIENDGYELNMLEILPPNIDITGRKKYPVLIRVYGGPGSQMVSNRFERDWHSYLAASQRYIIVMLDGRGTGFKGRNLRNPVRDDLGHWEVQDQIAAAREMAKRAYVDRSRIGIWGWSYGGYMTCKTIEAASGIFTLGMAVAPVTDWLYYDSIYTERYMSTPSANKDGYTTSAVNNVTSFSGDKVDFIWAHGSGDDNVHYVNSAALLDKLTQEQVRGWRFRMFTDSNHSMDKRMAYREVYEWMNDYLEEKWGKGGTVHH